MNVLNEVKNFLMGLVSVVAGILVVGVVIVGVLYYTVVTIFVVVVLVLWTIGTLINEPWR